MSGRRILVVGASGYIGGSVLDRFLKSVNAEIKDATYTALVRTQEQAAELSKHNVKAVLFKGLADVELLRQHAAENDIVLNSASAFDTEAVQALIAGLSQRQAKADVEVIYLHTSGTSSVGEYPVPLVGDGRQVLSDKDDDIYAHMQALEKVKPYPQRTTDIAVIDAGLTYKVKTYIIMSPTIYGPGTGLFNRDTIQVPSIIKRAVHRGNTPVQDTGAGRWDHVHIDDLAELYEIILSRALAKEPLPTGRKGIYFNENGNHGWLELSQKIAATGVKLGALKTDEVESLDPEVFATALGDPATPASVQAVALGLASWSRTRADLARSLGWNPKHGDESWEGHIETTFRAVVAKDH